MTPATLQRYAPGGDIYGRIVSTYGPDAANRLYQAAQTGDENGEVNAELTRIKFGKPLNDSTASLFVEQVTTDPLAAPLASANSQIQNAALSFLRSPWVLLLIAAWLFFQFGGAQWAQKKLFK
jgi:hypothetical protein